MRRLCIGPLLLALCLAIFTKGSTPNRPIVGGSRESGTKTVCLSPGECATFTYLRCAQPPAVAMSHTSGSLRQVFPSTLRVPLSQLGGKERTDCRTLDLQQVKTLIKAMNQAKQKGVPAVPEAAVDALGPFEPQICVRLSSTTVASAVDMRVKLYVHAKKTMLGFRPPDVHLLDRSVQLGVSCAARTRLSCLAQKGHCGMCGNSCELAGAAGPLCPHVTCSTWTHAPEAEQRGKAEQQGAAKENHKIEKGDLAKKAKDHNEPSSDSTVGVTIAIASMAVVVGVAAAGVLYWIKTQSAGTGGLAEWTGLDDEPSAGEDNRVDVHVHATAVAAAEVPPVIVVGRPIPPAQ